MKEALLMVSRNWMNQKQWTWQLYFRGDIKGEIHGEATDSYVIAGIRAKTAAKNFNAKIVAICEPDCDGKELSFELKAKALAMFIEGADMAFMSTTAPVEPIDELVARVKNIEVARMQFPLRMDTKAIEPEGCPPCPVVVLPKLKCCCPINTLLSSGCQCGGV